MSINNLEGVTQIEDIQIGKDQQQIPSTPRKSLVMSQIELNNCAKCPAARNQIYILSTLNHNGRMKKTQPALCLDCRIRNHLGWGKKVYLEQIKRTCCGEYRKCEAYAKFMAQTRPTFSATNSGKY